METGKKFSYPQDKGRVKKKECLSTVLVLLFGHDFFFPRVITTVFPCKTNKWMKFEISLFYALSIALVKCANLNPTP